MTLGGGGVRRRVARQFYGELDNHEKKTKLVIKFKHNDQENIITESGFINNNLLKPSGNFTYHQV
jgi:hypothetical protein